MRPYSERSIFVPIDPADQPKGTHVLTFVLGTSGFAFQIDRAVEDGDSLVGLLGETPVVQIPRHIPHMIVNINYLELSTTGQEREAVIEDLPSKVRYALRYNQVGQEAEDEAKRNGISSPQSKSNFEEWMRKMMGQGEDDKL